MALLKAEMVETMEDNLDDALWDRELSEGAKLDPWLLEMARAMFPGHTEHEYRRAVLAVTCACGPERLYWDGKAQDYITHSQVLRIGARR